MSNTMVVAYGRATERQLNFIRNIRRHLSEATFKTCFGIRPEQQAKRAYKLNRLLGRELAKFGM